MNCRSNQPVQVGYRIMDFHYLAKTVASCFLYESRERSAITIPIIQFYGEMERDDQKGIRTAEQWVRLMYSELPAPKAAGADTATATEAPPAPATAPAAEKPTEEAVEEGLVPVKANVTSVFYRRPSPDEPPFVEVGDEVQEDTVVCLLEVMKCFRQVTADVRGRIEKIGVESSELVENGTVLFWIRPA
jgi:acetyl-CoA carboxylase biotin carboxyl carrier protein